MTQTGPRPSFTYRKAFRIAHAKESAIENNRKWWRRGPLTRKTPPDLPEEAKKRVVAFRERHGIDLKPRLGVRRRRKSQKKVSVPTLTCMEQDDE